ncbi:hypothetical protein N9Z41_01050 [bacterium]|nr:hypothetical protein [bacterium]
MKKLVILNIISLFWACSPEEEIINSPCLDGDCNAEFVINPISQPYAYEDENGYWHLFHMGVNYFTIDGVLDEMLPEYYINKVPSVETAYDSNYWIWIQNFRFTVPLYSFLGYFSGGGYNTPIPIDNKSYTITDMAELHAPLNIVGYQINKNACIECPYYETIVGTYSKYILKPKQNIFFDNEMIGDTAVFHMRVRWGNDFVNIPGEEKNYELKVVFDGF